MMRKNERSHYKEIAQYFKREVSSYLGANWKISCSENTTYPNLRDQVNAICEDLGIESRGQMFPSILTDVVLGATCDDQLLRLAKIEVKGPASSLGLVDFSQLIGYLQVASFIQVGVLLLIENAPVPSPISNDFDRLITGGRLPVKWRVSSESDKYLGTFETGICSYVPNGLVHWVNLESFGGIATWADFAESIKASSPL